MPKLRIIHSEAAKNFGGQEHFILRTLRVLRAQGHAVEAICQPDAKLTKVLRQEGFVVHTLVMGGIYNYLVGVFKLWWLLARGKYDVVNCHSRIDTVLVGSAARLARVPVIVRTRHLAKKVGSLFSYNIIPNRLIAPSNFVRQYLIAKGVCPTAISVVYPSIDPCVIDEAPLLDLRAELQLSKQSLLIGCVAVLRREKGHKELIEAVAPLCVAKPDLHLIIVGGGSPAYEQELHAMIQATGLSSQIHMLGTRADVPSLLPNFDIFALATHTEASGTAFVEAGCAGVPTVGTRVQGVPEMVVENSTALLVSLFDVDALRTALKRLIDDEALRKQFGKAGKEFCRSDERFTPKAMLDRTEAAYKQWLKELKQ